MWRVTTAEKSAVLIDGAAYFSCLRAALLDAQQTIYIAGWDIDTRTPLWPANGQETAATDGDPSKGDNSPVDDLPLEIGAFLIELVKRRPRLQVKILLWDYAIIYAPDRELAPEYHFLWTTPPQIDLCLDDEIPVGSSHHQKLVIIDQHLAFCGGMDLTTKRWDTPDHDSSHPARLDPRGIAYPPRHDVHMAVTGEAACALDELFRDRWQQAARETLPKVDGAGNSTWDLSRFSDHCFDRAIIGISRTVPPLDDQAAVQEVRALYLDQLKSAERFIYIESQYVTFDEFAAALAKRLQERPELEALIVCPLNYGAWVENSAMCAGRERFVRILEQAGVADRVAVVYPVSHVDHQSTPILVHSKLFIVDDTYLRIGSSNLCNRSMGADTECDLTLYAATGNKVQQGTIASVRDTLIGEHLGLRRSDIEEHFTSGQGMSALLSQSNDGRRRLLPIPRETASVDRSLACGIADPLEPIDARQLFFARNLTWAQASTDQRSDIESDRLPPRSKGQLRNLVLLSIGLLLLAACWSFSPLAHLARPDLWRGWLDHVRGPWEFLAIIAIYVVAGFFAFPIVILIAITAALFGAWPGSLYAFSGAMASAAVTYLIGRWVGRDSLRRFLGPRLNRASESFVKSGIVTTTIARLVPAAPYTLVNLAAGALHINFAHYLIGTAFGLAPGIIVMAALGRHITWSIQHPTWGNMSILAAMIIGSVLLAVGVQRLVKFARRRRHD